MPNLIHNAIALYGKDALVWKYKACLYIDSSNGPTVHNRIPENLNVPATSYYYVSTLVGFPRTRLIVHNINVTGEFHFAAFTQENEGRHYERSSIAVLQSPFSFLFLGP
jgi:hypothetical protein